VNKYDQYLTLEDAGNAMTLAAPAYTDPDFFILEQALIFKHQWQLVGHVHQLPENGDQILAQIGKVPLVIVRNLTGEIKAFHNVCGHRAGPLATGNGNNKVLRCKYHGWTYGLDGALQSAPEMQSTANFEICQHHLPQASVEIWQGFIFCAIQPPEQSVATQLNGIAEQILPIDLSRMHFHHRDEYVIECNWKVYMDNYLEGYHLPHVHPGLNQLLDYRSYDTRVYPGYSYQSSPLENPENNQADIYYGEGQAHYYCIFPNLMLNILPGRLQTNVIMPLGHKQTRVVFDSYYIDAQSEQSRALIDQDQSFSDQVQQEDISICEQVQKGLDSGSYHSGPLCSKRETGVLHFQNLVRAAIKSMPSLG